MFARLLASLMICGECAAAPTEVLYFFDAEDYVNERSFDAVRDLSRLFREEGETVHIALVGYLAETLSERGRTDVIEAMKPHLLGTQSMYHSRHPNILELSDDKDYSAAYARIHAEEERGIRSIERLSGKKCLFAVPPGPSKSYVAMNVYADLGIKFYCDTVCCDDIPSDIEYQNLWQIPYSDVKLESLIPPSNPDMQAMADAMAKKRRVALYLHPCMAVCSEFWDGVNYRGGNLCEFGQWKPSAPRSAEDTKEYYARLRKFIRLLRADGRFAFPTLEDLAKRKSKLESNLCMADRFAMLVKQLRGEDFVPGGKVYGFLSEPYRITNSVSLKVADVKSAAAKIDLNGFLPSEIEVGGTKIGPADFMQAAKLSLVAGGDEITIKPEDPKDLLDDYPALRDFHPKGTWLFPDSFKDEYASDRLRLQFWTLRRVR